MKKVTLQEIANSLGISRTTVWKVFSGHEGVSDSLRTKVIAKAQELGYAIPEDFQYPQSAEETTPVNIAVAVCPHDFHLATQQGTQRLHQTLLHTRSIRLDLPAVISGAIISQVYKISLHGLFCVQR